MKKVRFLAVLAISFMSVMSLKAQGQRMNEFQNEFSKYQAQYRDLMQNGKHKEAMDPLTSCIALLDTTTIFKVSSIPEAAIMEQKGLLYYDQACCYALTGQKKQALAALEQSVLLGYKDYNNMVNDNDLRSLRKDKKYLSLLAQVNDRQPLSVLKKSAPTPINGSTKLSKEQVLAHVDELKKLIDDKIWPAYNDPAYSMEMNYYEDGPFRMHLDQAEDDTLARMECSSPEITIQAVPSVKTYEEWYAMLMHECFHGFQYKHTDFWNKMLASTPENFITSDSLKALRRNYEWYRDMLSKENALLKKAYEASDIHEACHILSGFYSIRDKRLKTVKDRLGLDIIEFYPIIETVEGSARYIEYRLAREQGITDTDWMTNLDSNSCYYASGLYLMLIMDKFGIPYKEELFLKYNTLTELIQDKTRQEINILMEIRPEVNYVTHLYTLAGLGFADSTYAAKYGNTLPQAAIDTLQKYKGYLTFGQGEGGMLAGPFFFGVSGENIPNIDSMQVVMNVVMNEGKKANAPADVMAAAHAIAGVYMDHYDAYLKDVYPQVKADMEERQQLLSQKIEKQSFVKDWERVTGYTWHRGDYHWLLYRAGQKGPSYNNLNDSTNTVWYNQDIDYQLAMFSHEFGIFLMQDSIDPIVEEFKGYTRKLESERDLTYVPWSAFESLACWYNCKIAGHETSDYRAFGEADVQTFCRIFDRLSKEGISDPAELYRKGIMEYLEYDNNERKTETDI